MIYNIKTKQKIQTSQSMIQLYGSITEFIKSISLFEYQPNNWIIGENNINYFLYVDSIDVERQIKYSSNMETHDIKYAIKQLQFRINDPCGPPLIREMENVKLKQLLYYYSRLKE